MIKFNDKRKTVTVVSMIICVVLMIVNFTTACLKSKKEKTNSKSETETLEVSAEPINKKIKFQEPENFTLPITMEEAEQKAKDIVLQSHPKSKDKLEIVKAYESTFMGKEMYMFDIEYRNEKPTAIDYSFDASVGVDKLDGSAQVNSKTHDLSGLDTIGKDKAIEMARGYIADGYSIDENMLEFVEMQIVDLNAIEYYLNFEYENMQYTCGILVDTGEMDSLQQSVKQ